MDQDVEAAIPSADQSPADDMRFWYDEQSKALALAQQAGKCATWIMDVDKQEVRWLPGGYEIFGMPFADFAGRIRPIDLVEPDHREEILAVLKRTVEKGAPFIVEYRLRWPNGDLHWQEARGGLDPDQPNIIRGTTFDITERKTAELALLRIEKLAAVGRVASTIAHEINNPLESVTNLLYLALLEDSIPNTVRSYLLTAQEELQRLSNISRLTLSFARPQGKAKEIDPLEVIHAVLYVFRRRLEGKGIDVRIVQQSKCQTHTFVDDLQRIFTNVIANAIDAIHRAGGILLIHLSSDESSVLISVEDNGSGIGPEHADRIFEAFYTTKEEIGTGVGLWVTKELIEKNGGSIRLADGPHANGMRTRFEIRLPVASRE